MMRIETAIKRLQKEFERAQNDEIIRDPVAYALYYTWRAADASQIKEAKKQ